MKKFIFLLFVLVNTSYADINLVPVVGMERVQKFEPKEYTSNRLYYGVRLVAGKPLLSFEAEVTQAKDDKTFNDLDRKTNENSTNGSLGIRSTFGQGPMNFFLRMGGTARKSEIKTTVISTGTSTTEEPPIVINPYAGTGLSINFGNIFRLNAGLTAVFAGSPRGSDIDYQATLGYSMSFSQGR